MAVIISPRYQFQGHKDRRERWAQIANDPVFHAAVTHALAEMVSRGLAPDALAGVNGFIYTLSNMHEDLPLPKQIPAKPLTSFDPPTIAKPTAPKA